MQMWSVLHTSQKEVNAAAVHDWVIMVCSVLLLSAYRILGPSLAASLLKFTDVDLTIALCTQFDQILASYKEQSKQWRPVLSKFAEGMLS